MIRTFGVIGAACAALGLLAPPTRASDAIQKAIHRGVAYLKQLQAPDGSWPLRNFGVGGRPYYETGAAALAGLTLLECGTPVGDRSVQQAAAAVRKGSSGMNTTYPLALAILFFDRLGDLDDVPLIQALSVRLLAGQNPDGGWTYDCPTVGGDAEVQRVAGLVGQRAELVRTGQRLRPVPRRSRGRADLPVEIKQLFKSMTSQPLYVGRTVPDNSNTQFALLGLWAAHRHGIPIENSLRRADQRFRASQNADGGWGYGIGHRSDGAMTCAGLLGLAMEIGLHNETALRTFPEPDGETPPRKRLSVRDPDRDRAIQGGLLALGTAIGQPPGKLDKAFYFLWSVERVAVTFGLKTISKKDWYAWGSEILLASQQGDGSWNGGFCSSPVDTCFALLFLRRANIVSDLTFSLRGKRDPGEVSLRSVGESDKTLQDGQGLPPANDSGPGRSNTAGPAGQPPETFPSLPRLEPARGPVRNADATAPATSRPERPGPPALSPAELDRQAARLSNQLLQAPVSRQFALLKEYANAKGVLYTQALATAIPQLSGGALDEARDLLAERLARMTTETLRDKLQDENREVRGAAALACARKGDKQCVSDLIALLEDPDRLVTRATHRALTQLTGRDFGPAEGATLREQADAVRAWKAWWQKQAR
jgi:hypothetical protein